MTEERIIKNIAINPDSLEIGTPGKDGAIKIYGDFANKKEFKSKIDNGIELKNHLQSQMENNKKSLEKPNLGSR